MFCHAQLLEGEQTGVSSDLGPVELKLESTVKSKLQSGPLYDPEMKRAKS